MSRLSRGLLGLGLAVGTLGCIALIAGLRPSALPPAVLDLAAYKLVFIAAGGLLVAGGVLGRNARRRGALPDVPIPAPPSSPMLAPGKGGDEPIPDARAERVRHQR